MRHRKSGRHLNRNSSHRKAMFSNMANSLFEHEIIKTTLPKAKELRRVAEPLITMAKEDSVAKRRLAFARLRDKAAVGKLFITVAATVLLDNSSAHRRAWRWADLQRLVAFIEDHAVAEIL